MIQDVDSSSLEANYQSFASLMEQRLAELFLVAGRQGPRTARARRATTVGGYTVQARVNAFFLTRRPAARFSGLQRRDERARG